MNDSRVEHFIEATSAMAQDVQDYIAEGEKGGSVMTESKAVITEYEAAYKAYMEYLNEQAHCSKCDSEDLTTVTHCPLCLYQERKVIHGESNEQASQDSKNTEVAH